MKKIVNNIAGWVLKTFVKNATFVQNDAVKHIAELKSGNGNTKNDIDIYLHKGGYFLLAQSNNIIVLEEKNAAHLSTLLK